MEDKPASLLVVSLGKALNGMPRYVANRWRGQAVYPPWGPSLTKDTLTEDELILLFIIICHFYPPFTRKRIVSLYFGQEVRTRLGVAFFEIYGLPVFHIKVGRPVKCLAQGHNKRTCRLVLHNFP